MNTTSLQVIPAGPTIHGIVNTTTDKVIKAAQGLPTATLHEAGGRIGVMPAAIKPITPSFKVCGSAVTVHSPGGDNLWLHRAIYVAKPGDILVVHVSGVYDYGYWGEIMSTAARACKLGGLVIDGCVRDGDVLGRLGFPVFARGLSIRGTGKDYEALGWINAPVLFDGLCVNPGDLVVGDNDGVVVIPSQSAQEIVTASLQREAKESDVLRRIEAGERTLEIYDF